MQMNLLKKKILHSISMLLCVAMLVPVAVFAENDDVDPDGGTEDAVVEAAESESGEVEDAAVEEDNVSEAAVQEYPQSAAAIAGLLREGLFDVTGNGAADETDALAMLMHMTGSIPDLSALPGLLQGSVLGEKYLDAFLYTGIEQDENGYRSAKVKVSLSTVREKKLTYYVADILVRDINCFRTQFAQDRYAKIEHVEKTAARNNAIVAVNGDYYRARQGGIIIRNGEVYRKTVLKDRDVCVLYQDGVMECYSPSDVKINEILERGAYQSWTFGPSLLKEDGSAKTNKKEFRTGVFRQNPRTAIGYLEPGHYVLVVVDGRKQNGSLGLDMVGLSDLMASLGCKVAYNLDGGGTSVMTTTAYGALNKQSNADRMCSDIVLVVEDGDAFSAGGR